MSDARYKLSTKVFETDKMYMGLQKWGYFIVKLPF